MRLLPPPLRCRGVATATATPFSTGEKSLGSHKYSCLMACLSEPLRKQITDWAIENILDCHLTTEGREPHPHITIKYGLTDPSQETIDALTELLERFGPLQIKLANSLSLFRGGKDGDVLKVDVESRRLLELNRLITDGFECVDKFPDYHPHITVAYLDPAAAELYAEEIPPFLGTAVSVDQAEWSGTDGRREILPLGRLLPSFQQYAARREQLVADAKHWVTLEPSGTHVDIEDGEIAKGPAGVVGKSPRELSARNGKPAKHQPTPPKVESAFPADASPRLQTDEKLKEEHKRLAKEMPELDEKQLDSIGDYCAGSYIEINGALRAGKTPTKGASVVPVLEKAIASAPVLEKPVSVYRGLRLSADEEEQFLQRLGQGGELEIKGFTSTSLDYRVANQFSSGAEASIIFEIAARQGLYVGESAGNSKEKEMILQNNSRFRIAGVKEVEIADGVKKRVVQLEQLL